MENVANNSSDNLPRNTFHRECFYLDNLANYYYLPDPRYIDLLADIKQLIAQYSAGIALTEIDQYLEGFSIYSDKPFLWNLKDKEHYYLAISLASWIYLRKEYVDYDNLIKLIPLDQDRLIRYIATNDVELDLTLKINQTAPYIHFMGYILHDEKHFEYIDRFLLQFYAGIEPCSWHDSHIKDTSQFFGYWSFTLAAMVMKNTIFDVSFVDHMFYPRDLVGRELLTTWEDSPRGEKAREKKQAILKAYEETPDWVKFTNLGFVDRAIPTQLLKVLQEQEEELFSQAFIHKLRLIGDGEEQAHLYEDPEKLKELLTQFAMEIVQSVEKQEEIKRAFSEEVIKTHLAEKLENSYAAMPIELREEIESYFNSEQGKELIKQNSVDYKELGEHILKLNDKYKEDSEEYWDSMEDLMKEYNIMSPGVPEEKIQEEVSKKIKENMKKRTGKVNFNISLKDYL